MSTSSVYAPIQPAQTPNANGLMFDLEVKILDIIRRPVTIADWHLRFAYSPPGSFPHLDVRFPIDLAAFGAKAHKGEFNFTEGTSTYTSLSIEGFSDGTHLDVRKLRDPTAQEIIAWGQRETGLMNGIARFLPPKIYAMLLAGKTTGAVWTGGSNFFATDHNVNPAFPGAVADGGLGTFSNLIQGGGANATTPVYFVLEGGPFTDMRPWAILTGDGMGPAIAAAAGSEANVPQAGDPWIVRWGTEPQEALADRGMKVKIGVYFEKGWGFLFPQSILRYEGTLNYAGLKACVDAACVMKDLNGYNPASQIKVAAILCEPTQVSTINEQLGREPTTMITNAPTGAQSAIDERLKGVPVIAMDR